MSNWPYCLILLHPGILRVVFFSLQGQWDHAHPTPSFLAPKGGLSAMELNVSEELNYAQMTKPQLHVLCYVLCGGFTSNSLAKRRGTRYLSLHLVVL